MDRLIERLMHTLEAVNSVLWHEYVLYVLLGVGVLFTVWSGFGQFRSRMVRREIGSGVR